MRKWTYLFFGLLGLSGVVFFLYSLDLNGWTKTLSGSDTDVSVQKEIPDQAIRLRILANSDRPEDQLLKRKVRDEIIGEISTWAYKPHNLEEAREIVKENLPRFEKIVGQTLSQHGYDGPFRIDYGVVPFPTKLYGTRVYPAGDYEALRITIGRGEGENWWCVLFPPLCFIDMSNGDAVSKENTSFSTSVASTQTAYASMDKEKKEEPSQKMEVRFLLLEKAKEWIGD
ncbi:stage II sporulation protein R [Thermoactinomyces mirandus]|uniref:Stage II sporulation protein R n=1 Tax=Thermoactinomyces mirandus TaxID=2756294 RepID=A0A7W2ARF9_9BACL|nr:stage II sporulation protein R [Thermoactinomyces mirandus]MBA4602944.1 stage II sporulation protein R [Thermoactinomyces mirandus]